MNRRAFFKSALTTAIATACATKVLANDNPHNNFQARFKQLRSLKNVAVLKTEDEYDRGHANGLERALALMEDREPVYVTGSLFQDSTKSFESKPSHPMMVNSGVGKYEFPTDYRASNELTADYGFINIDGVVHEFSRNKQGELVTAVADQEYFS